MTGLAAQLRLVLILILLAQGSHAWSLEEFLTDPKWVPLLQKVR